MSSTLDDDNPWPGLAAFDERSQRYFHGREQEIAALVARVESASMVVLFGKSGLGKTSLLRAGVMPRMREHGLLPVYVRLVLRPGAPAPALQLADALSEAIAAENIDAPPLGDESLWCYMHRTGLEFWDARNFPCTPVFILDQFEEIFTVAEDMPEVVTRWRVDFGDLVENRIPVGQAATPEMQLRSMRCKFLVSLREDFLPELEGWRAAIPSLGKTRMRLLPMSTQQAFEAVHGAAPHLLDEAMASRIVDFVAAAQAEPQVVASGETAPRSTEVEPALLSLFCQGLNEKRRLQGKVRFDDALLDEAKQTILSDYYRSCFAGMPAAVSRFVATELITEKGYRNSVAKDDVTPAHISEEQLATLIDRRLLRMEERYGAERIELTHDLLTRVVREEREHIRHADEVAAAAARADHERAALQERLQRERDEAERRQMAQELRGARRFRMLAGGLAVMLVFAVGAAWLALERGQRADAEHKRAEVQRAAAEEERARAQRESQLATARLNRIRTSLGMKRAVLANDEQRINSYLQRDDVKSALRFTATGVPTGGADPQGRRLYRFSLMPQEAVDELRKSVAVVTYRMAHETFRNSLLATGPDRGFVAGYTGWGCLTNVVVLIEYIEPDRGSEIASFNMCQELSW